MNESKDDRFDKHLDELLRASAPQEDGRALEPEKSTQYIVEGIILRRLHEKRIEGYTLEMSKEIAAALTRPQPGGAVAGTHRGGPDEA